MYLKIRDLLKVFLAALALILGAFQVTAAPFTDELDAIESEPNERGCVHSK